MIRSIPQVKRTYGLTLPELLGTLGIVSILTAIAVPGFEHTVTKQQASSALQILVEQLELARHSAISANRPVVLCAADLNENACLDSNDWSGALLMFIDHNQNGKIDDDDKLLNSISQLASHGSITSNADSYLRFDPFGNIAGIGRSFRYCPRNSSTRFARGLSVNAQGRYRIWHDTNDNGIVDFNGSDISC